MAGPADVGPATAPAVTPTRRSRRPRPPLLLMVTSSVAAIAVVVPLAYIVVRATDRGWEGVRATLWRDRTLDLIMRSLGLAGAVTLAALVIGVGAAWVVARTDVWGRRFWQVVLGLPLAMPSYVAGWAWIGWRPELAGFRGAWLVLVTITYPFVYLPVLGALRRADPAIEEVARSLGVGPVRTFFTVTLPQVRIAAIGGGLLVGLYTLSDFGAVSIMRFEALTHVIYRSYRASFDRIPPAVLGCVLVVLSLVIVAAANRVQGRAATARVGRGALRSARPVRLGWWQLPVLTAFTGLIALAFVVPARMLVLWTYRGRSQTDWSRLVDAALTTLWVGVLAAIVTVIVALPIAMLSARHPGRFSRAVTSLAYAGHSLPGIVVALAMVFFGIRLATPIYQRTPMLIFAYVVLFLSLAVGAMHNAIAQAPPALEEAARSLGRSQRRAWAEVTLPIAAPGIGVAAALVCLAVMKELPATLLLRPIGTDTLATRLWSQTDAHRYAAAAPFAATIVVVAAVPTAVLSRLGSRQADSS